MSMCLACFLGVIDNIYSRDIERLFISYTVVHSFGPTCMHVYIDKYNVHDVHSYIFVAGLLFMQAYNFPADVSFSFGGPGSPKYFMNQLHYDNPNEVTGICVYIEREMKSYSTTKHFTGGWII